jgi:hypothetical protein
VSRENRPLKGLQGFHGWAYSHERKSDARLNQLVTGATGGGSHPLLARVEVTKVEILITFLGPGQGQAWILARLKVDQALRAGQIV